MGDFRRIALAVVTVLLVAFVAACGGDDGDDQSGAGDQAAGPPDQPVTIRMGWGIPEEEIKYVMMEYPEIAKNLGTWYTVDWQQFAGTALGVQGLAAGTLDCATVGGLSVANGIDGGAEIVILGGILEERAPDHTTAWMVRKDSGIDSLEDLRGKRVATSAIGGSTDYIQDFYIEDQAGLVAGEDYEKVEVPFGQMVETLLSGRVDMGLFPQPFEGQINATGEVKPIFRLNDAIEPFVQLLNGCRRDFVEDNREVIERFQEDWVTVANWVLDPANRKKVIKASTAATKIPTEVLEQFLLTDADYFRPKNGAVSLDALQKEWDFFRELGGIEQDLTVQDHVIDELLPPGSGGGVENEGATDGG